MNLMLHKLVKVKLNATHKSILSDLFVDLAAGWLGAIIVNNKANILTLTTNFLLAILSLIAAYQFKRLKYAKRNRRLHQ